jgi:hypothetical protein
MRVKQYQQLLDNLSNNFSSQKQNIHEWFKNKLINKKIKINITNRPSCFYSFQILFIYMSVEILV